MKQLIRLTSLILLTLLLASCAGQQTREAGPMAGQEQAGEAGEAGQAGAETIGTGQQEGFQGHVLDNPDKLLYQKVIYFDTDEAVIKDKYRDVVRAHGHYLASHPGARVTLEGHADERGSREYNLGLGERRAEAVAELLIAYGASPDQITMISYGEEKPVALCHNESCWSQNRRVVIVYTDRG